MSAGAGQAAPSGVNTDRLDRSILILAFVPALLLPRKSTTPTDGPADASGAEEEGAREASPSVTQSGTATRISVTLDCSPASGNTDFCRSKPTVPTRAREPNV